MSEFVVREKDDTRVPLSRVISPPLPCEGTIDKTLDNKIVKAVYGDVLRRGGIGPRQKHKGIQLISPPADGGEGQ